MHGPAEGVLADWRASTEPVSVWMRSAGDPLPPPSLTPPPEALGQIRPSHLGTPLSAGEVMGTLIDEQTHHGAEVALLRDLYLRRA